ncbi:KilA-N domain-containing protein [Moraxella sp. ZY210820]|uniref:KilA-N domain-containing protein n=1 Tax=Moraxella sp. ZY210820 TaxID=2904123 RepID=UPI002730B42D|nr:KilA-N domain-containing protein [Moraxella sp. ZY210820]WLF84843.1 KilA-N domain-containing protein [Moraxella sp. ZY210820]
MNLTISNQTISQYNGLFSLNDLHKVSGNASKHKPTNFLRNEQTKDLIAEIESENQIAYHTIQGGDVKTVKQGTYVCRELVYAYAMWISAKFSLMVIRAFDALNTGAISCLPKLSSDDTLQLRNAVNLATGVLKLDYSTIYKMVHQRFGVDEIKELSREQIGQAVEYVHHLMV